MSELGLGYVKTVYDDDAKHHRQRDDEHDANVEEVGTAAALTAPRIVQPFSSRLSSFQWRQSVPSARILFGLDLIMPASRSRSA